MTAIKAVLFDVDDTLFDYHGASRAGILGYLAALGEAADDAAYARWLDLERTAYTRFLAQELTFLGQRRERARAMAARALSDAEADAWFDGYRAHFEAAWTTFPDVHAALTALAGYRLGVLSNSDTAYQRDKLARLGLGEVFDVVLGTDLAGAAKPEPAAFLAGCAALGTDPAETAYVGDLLDVDAFGAAAAGLRGVWLDRSSAAGPAAATAMPVAGVVRVASLGELPALFAAS